MISGPEIKLINNDIYATFSLSLEAKYIQQMKEGIDKELKFYVDLFRVWENWPDEFVLGKFYSKTLRADPIKKEFVATSFDGNIIIERRFRSFESMLEWSLSFKDLKLANTKELEPGRYFLRVSIESKIRKFPPVIRYFFVFVSENEFRIRRDSGYFTLEGNK